MPLRVCVFVAILSNQSQILVRGLLPVNPIVTGDVPEAVARRRFDRSIIPKEVSHRSGFTEDRAARNKGRTRHYQREEEQVNFVALSLQPSYQIQITPPRDDREDWAHALRDT
jgi:hypothetical protein